jgi:hypothetical protein
MHAVPEERERMKESERKMQLYLLQFMARERKREQSTDPHQLFSS